MASEPIRLADGEHLQTLIPGVAPVAQSHSDMAHYASARAARRTHQALPAGGLFDDVARAQTELF